MKPATALLGLLMLVAMTRHAAAWEDEGHEVVALIAQSFLEPEARAQVDALLAADTDSLAAHDIAGAATWADRHKEANVGGSRERTLQWHFTNIEIMVPDLDVACFHFPRLSPGTLASNGPAADCLVQKVDQFTAELADSATNIDERILALKFLLHFVGDLHQPLHSSDDHDRGGNDKMVSASIFRDGNLHHYWDAEFVSLIETHSTDLPLIEGAKSIAAKLTKEITKEQAQKWRLRQPSDWAIETFYVAKSDAYGRLPPPSRDGSYYLPAEYIKAATEDVAQQLSKAGVRLASILNNALRKN